MRRVPTPNGIGGHLGYAEKTIERWYPDVKNPLFILAAGVLLVTGSIVGATKAADSGTPKAQAVTFSTANLSVELQEKQSGKFVTIQETRNADGSLNPSALGKLEFTSLEKVNAGEEMPDPSITYDEEVQVKNNGDCQEYIRVVVYKNWINADKSKNDALDISSANLHLVNPSEWIVKESDSKECTTYYLKKALDAEDTAKLFDTISFDNSILNSVPEVTTEKTDKKPMVSMSDTLFILFSFYDMTNTIHCLFHAPSFRKERCR